MTIGQKIKKLCEENNIKPCELSKSIGITHATLSRYITGDREPKLQNICMIADYFAVSVDWLCGREVKRMTNEQAIEVLNDIHLQCCDVDSLLNTINWEDRCKALDMAIEALQKKTERKAPNYYGDGYADGYMVYDSAECPSCGYIYEEDDGVWGEPYCPHCGQALDWDIGGEEDDE